MATTTTTGRPPLPQPMAAVSISSIPSILKAYSIPLFLLGIALFFQLVVTPRSFPPSHYDVLGVKKYASIEEVTQAYEKLTSHRDSGVPVPSVIDFVKAQYAFELLTNELWKRDYDNFGIDEQSHVINQAAEQYAGASFSEINIPLMESNSFDPAEHNFDVINSENFLSQFESTKALLIQVFSFGSNHCANFSNIWKRIVTLLDGVANTGMVELGDAHLAAYLAEKKTSGQPFFRNGLPTLLAFPPGCTSSRCLHRYGGQLSVDAITDWLATTILRSPRILYYSKESMVQNFLAKVKPHKVRVIFFSRSGERATPFIRQAAINYWSYAAFAFTRWDEEDSSFWWNMFGVESAPAIVILKDPGVKPIIYHGMFFSPYSTFLYTMVADAKVAWHVLLTSFRCLYLAGSINNSMFIDIMEKNKYHVLPQLRSLTSVDLGCDARGYSRAGSETRIWYCVIVAGRLSQELNKMRETIRRVQEALTNNGELTALDQDSLSAPAVLALNQKRLTFTWLDGEAQQKYCFFHVNSEDSYETCGTRRAMIDVPRLLLVRYERNVTDDGNKIERQPRNIFEALQHSEPDPASQLVAKYMGSDEIPEIISWISKTIEDGDSRNLPSFRTKCPELVPEDADPLWHAGSEKIISSSKDLKHKITGFINQMHNQLGDPRIGPVLLLVALMLFGRTWLQRSQTTKIEPNSSNQAGDKDKVRQNRKTRPRNDLIPPSITDLEPKEAQQMQFSDSDSDK
ncbi:hypothetical protein ACH5RR_007731 [Cinchona calisaya]|uniref:J domain-containing protein n=1 Tax=Cinchona calisaya TaxID=153742 RepID=A0ABD3AB10_9GENT